MLNLGPWIKSIVKDLCAGWQLALIKDRAAELYRLGSSDEHCAAQREVNAQTYRLYLQRQGRDAQDIEKRMTEFASAWDQNLPPERATFPGTGLDAPTKFSSL